MREKLGLERGDVHVDGAVPLAPLAGETEVERLLHVLVAPARDWPVTAHELLEQMRTPPRRMLFLVRHHEARTHHVVIRIAFAVLPTALSDSDAARRRAHEAAAVVRVTKMCIELLRVVVRQNFSLS